MRVDPVVVGKNTRLDERRELRPREVPIQEMESHTIPLDSDLHSLTLRTPSQLPSMR